MKTNYRAWAVNEKDFPKNGTTNEQIKFLLNYGVLAPSTHNSQPWLFTIKHDVLTIIPNKDRRLEVGDPDGLGLFISVGSLVENIVQAAGYFQLSTKVTLRNGLVSMEFNGQSKANSGIHVKHIKSRHSNKFEYQAKSVPDSNLKELRALQRSHVRIFVLSKDQANEYTRIHLNSAKRVAEDPKFGIELSGWLRRNGTRSFDGMPGFVIGNSNLKSLLGKVVLKRKPTILAKLVEGDKRLLDSSPSLVVFTVNKKLNPDLAIEAGRVIELFWLKLTELGIVAHPMFASIQDKSAHSEIRKLIKTNDTPVFFLRIGYSKGKHFHTPRIDAYSHIQNA